MKTLTSYLAGEWVSGKGRTSQLVNPSTEEVVAESCTEGLDLGRALSLAREQGGPALRALSFAERGAILRQLAESIVGCRKELLDLSIENNGSTRSDAKFDVDGASFTLQAYADLGEELGDKHYLVDG